MLGSADQQNEYWNEAHKGGIKGVAVGEGGGGPGNGGGAMADQITSLQKLALRSSQGLRDRFHVNASFWLVNGKKKAFVTPPDAGKGYANQARAKGKAAARAPRIYT